MKPKNQEDISTDWELNLNECWGADMIPEWENIQLPEWNLEFPEWDIQLLEWDSMLSEDWNNTTDKKDIRKQPESPDITE